jgi:drug/metabolite transporter (DMT)-like permease
MKIFSLIMRSYGFFLVFLGTFWVSPDALLVILTSKTEKKETIIFWKYFFASIMQGIFTFLYKEGVFFPPKSDLKIFIQAIIFNILTSVSLTLAFIMTSSAKALILFSMHLIWSSLGGRIFFKDILPYRTLFLALVGIATAVTIFVTSTKNSKNGTVEGDIIAVLSGIFFASLAMTNRKGKEVSMVGTTFCSSLIISVLTLMIILGIDQTPEFENLRWAALYIFLDGFVVIGAAIIMYTIGTKYITSTEFSVICLLEPFITPLWVYLALGEVPQIEVVISGSVLLFFMFCHELINLKYSERKTIPTIPLPLVIPTIPLPLVIPTVKVSIV